MNRGMERALKAAKEARGGGGFLPFRIDVLRSQALAGLTPYAAKLLLDIARFTISTQEFMRALGSQ